MDDQRRADGLVDGRRRWSSRSCQLSAGGRATIEVPLEAAGWLKARLVMKWTLGPIESLFVTEERVLLATGVVLLVMLVLLARRLP